MKDMKNEENTLSIFCVDTVNIKDKVTFDSIEDKKLQVTFWMEDNEKLEETLEGMFNILFDSMFNTKGDEIKKSDINS